ncbi:MAG: hypothetical protein ACOYYS_06700 [Chloroflexota bacterium]
MKTLQKLFALLLLSFFALAFPASALAAGPQADGRPDKIIFGGNFTLESGDTLAEGLVVFGGSVVIEKNATVSGDIAVMGGDLDCAGLIEGNVLVMGGEVSLGETAIVERDVVTLGGTFNRAPGARIEGDVVSEMPDGLRLSVDGPRVFVPSFTEEYLDGVYMNYIPPVWGGLWFLWAPFAMLTMAALAMIVVMFWPKPIERIADAAVAQPLIAGGMGLLTVIVLPFALVVMVVFCVTIVAIPIVIVGLGLAALMGWIAIGLELGKRIAVVFKQDWHPALAAGIGVFLLTLVAAGVDQAFRLIWLSCIGWVVPTAIGLVALGAALLTRFGTVAYPAPASAAGRTLAEAETEVDVNSSDEVDPVVGSPEEAIAETEAVEPEESPAPKRPARKPRTPKSE